MTPPGVSIARRRYCIGLALAAATAWLPRAGRAGAYDDFFRAIRIDHASAIASLLARGFDPNTIEPERGDTGLILALREDSMKAFRLLLNAAAVDIEAKSRNGDTSLMLACYKGNKAAADAAAPKGAEVNRPGWTPLHYAAAIGRNDIVQQLLDRFAYIDAESPNKTTPLMMAARGGHILTVKLLLDEGADETLKNDAGMTAIDFAARHNHKDIAEGLTSRLRKSGKL